MALKRKTSAKQKRGLKPPWKKGQSGNPAGKPTGTVSYTTALRKLLKENPKLIEQGAKAMARGVNRGSVGMTSLVLERIDGPVKKKVDLSVYSEAFDEDQKAALLDIISRNHPNHD